MMGNKARRLFRVNPNGFTLIELMITLAIGSIALGAIYGIFISSSQSHRTQEGVVDAQQRARNGLDFMAGSIRMAGFDPTGNADADIVGGVIGLQTQTIQFTADNNMDEDVLDAGENLTYTAVPDPDDPGTLMLTQNGVKLVDGLDPDPLLPPPLIFTCLDGNGDGLIDSVAITIRCLGRGSRGDILTRTLSNTVSCRNLGT